MNVELRQFRYFVAVAEELNFTRAAERLHIAQQPLSAAIARLEHQLGARLFERTTRRVTLTETGIALLEPARAALQAADTAVEAARAVAAGEVGDVSMGLSAGAWYGLGEFFEALAARHPGLRLHVHQQSTRPLLDAVRAGTLDLAVGLCVRDPAGLAALRLKDEPVILVISAGHPLAGRLDGDAGRRAGGDLRARRSRGGPRLQHRGHGTLRPRGFEPATRELQTHHDAWERAIAAGDCVGVTTRSSTHATHPGVRVLTLDPPATFPLDLLWLPSARPAIERVVEVARETAHEHGWVATTAGSTRSPR